jgi:hypothetical protein
MAERDNNKSQAGRHDDENNDGEIFSRHPALGGNEFVTGSRTSRTA